MIERLKKLIEKSIKRFKKKSFNVGINARSIEGIFYFNKMFEKIKDLDGDIVECGVGKAKSFQVLAALLNMHRQDRNLFGFDSFEGFPEPSIHDKSERNAKKGEWKRMTVNDVYRTLRYMRIDEEIISRVKIVKGFFKNTLPKAKIEKIALLHLDVDLYDSYKTCLEYLYPKVVRGGIIMFDEYKDKNALIKWPGAKKAIDEYLRQPLLMDELTGKYYLIKK